MEKKRNQVARNQGLTNSEFKKSQGELTTTTTTSLLFSSFLDVENN
jgi:hypothetical protein